jgi:hypothetical protein
MFKPSCLLALGLDLGKTTTLAGALATGPMAAILGSLAITCAVWGMELILLDGSEARDSGNRRPAHGIQASFLMVWLSR